MSGTNPRLVVVRGEDRGQELELDVAGEVRVGRGRSADFALADPSVSRHHVTVIYDGRSVRARDEGSGNGTLKNGVPMEGEVTLVDGDELELGETAIKLIHPSARVIVDSAPPRVERRAPPARTLRPLLIGGAAALVVLTLGIVAATLLFGRSSAAPAAAPVAVAAPGAPDGQVPVAEPPQQPIVVTQLAPPQQPQPQSAPARPPTRRSAERRHRRRVAEREPRREAARHEPSAAREARELYEDKDFAGAARAAREAADSGGPDADALLELARDYAAVGAGLTRGDANADSKPTVAVMAYQDALAADVRSGRSTHSAMIRAKLAKVAPAAARAFYDVGRYEAARAACDLAVNYNVGADPRVTETRKLLEDAAGELYRRAEALRAKDNTEAEHLLRRILSIVPSGSPWAGKALAALRE